MTACNPKSSLYSSRKDLTYLTLKQFCLHQKLFFHYVPLKIFNKVKSLLFNDIHSGYSGVSELFLLFSVHRLRAGSVWKSHTSSENVLEIQSACESMSKTDVQNMPAPWPLPSEVNRSQPGNPSQHCLHVRHFHLNPVCLSFFFFTHKTHNKSDRHTWNFHWTYRHKIALASKRGLVCLQTPFLLVQQCVHDKVLLRSTGVYNSPTSLEGKVQQFNILGGWYHSHFCLNVEMNPAAS